MSLPNPVQLFNAGGVSVGAKTTQVATGVYNATEADSIVISTSGSPLGAAETFSVSVATTDNSTRLLYNPASGATYQLAQNIDAIVLPGGFYYSFTKTTTAAATGIDVHVKPRIGFSGA